MSTVGECSECGEVKSCIGCSDGILCDSCISPKQVGSMDDLNELPTAAEGVETPKSETPWYGDFTDGEPFEIAVVDSGNCIFVVVEYDKHCFLNANGDEVGLDVNLRLATKKEVEGLYYGGD